MKPDFDKARIPKRSLIDLTAHSSGDFGLEDYVLSRVMGDVILVEFVDISDDGESILRNGLYVPVNTLTNAWRKGKVILTGPEVVFTSVGEIVLFPNNLGVAVANIEVKGHGKIKKGLFLNEARMFGVCELNDENR